MGSVNNEPVAWMSQGGDVSRSADYFVEMGFTDLIPLYTHPVKEQEPDLYSEDGFPLWTSPQFKELTDEEIAELSDKILCYQIYDNKESGVFEFARAILRKAQGD